MVSVVFHKIAENIPGLKTKLRQAGMYDEPEEFIRKTAFSSFYMTTGLFLIVWAFLSKVEGVAKGLIFLFPIIFVIMFTYMLKLPDVKIGRREKDISREIVFAGRFLLIELESGVPLYNSLVNISKNYPNIGRYFQEIVNKIDIGTPIEDAINETIATSPSPNLRKVLWQIINSLKTGADVTKSLSAVIEQIVKEQIIEVKEYGKKLNPLTMFYMMLAVIVPTLGTTMLIVLSNFVSLQISLGMLLGMAGFIGFIQFMFLAIIKSSRPAVEL